VALLVFAFIAASTWGDATPKPVVTVDENGIATERRDQPRNGGSETTVGEWDKANKRFVGTVTIRYTDKYTDFQGSEKVPMKDGKRHGKAVYTYPNGNQEDRCYQNGVRVDASVCNGGSKKSLASSLNDPSANDIFTYKYPWFAFKLNAFSFGADYVQAYLDTLELLLYATEFTEEEFTDYYDEVIYALEETPYDSLIKFNGDLSFYNGLDLIQDNEFRLATIDSYRDGEGNTFEVVQSTYSNYLLTLNELEITDADFEEFCRVYDSIMFTYVPLAPDDDFLIDSLEERMYRALNLIFEMGESDETESQALKSAWSANKLRSLYRTQQVLHSRFESQAVNATPPEISEFIMLLIILDFFNGDLLKNSVQEAYALNQGIVQLPVVVTNLSGNPSATSVTLEGNVVEDGGGEVSARGMVWESFFNPSLNNQVVTGGAGTGVFTATVSGLTEGETYYARAFATNAAGTSYGNCISFVAGGASGIEAEEFDQLGFQVYPNPATDQVTLSFKSTDAKGMLFSMYDLNGKLVLQEELENVNQGENSISINLSEIKSGMYTCRIEGKDKIHAIQKLMVSR
jgi:hypothetical protein